MQQLLYTFIMQELVMKSIIFKLIQLHFSLILAINYAISKDIS